MVLAHSVGAQQQALDINLAQGGLPSVLSPLRTRPLCRIQFASGLFSPPSYLSVLAALSHPALQWPCFPTLFPLGVPCSSLAPTGCIEPIPCHQHSVCPASTRHSLSTPNTLSHATCTPIAHLGSTHPARLWCPSPTRPANPLPPPHLPSTPMAPLTHADGSRSTKCASGLATPSTSACHTPEGTCRGASAQSSTSTSCSRGRGRKAGMHSNRGVRVGTSSRSCLTWTSPAPTWSRAGAQAWCAPGQAAHAGTASSSVRGLLQSIRAHQQLRSAREQCGGADGRATKQSTHEVQECETLGREILECGAAAEPSDSHWGTSRRGVYTLACSEALDTGAQQGARQRSS